MDGSPHTLDEFSDLVAHLYRAVLEPAELGRAMRRVDRWLGVDASYLVGWDLSQGLPRLQVVNEPGGLDHLDPAYVSHYAQIDPRRAGVDRAPVGQLLTCQQHFDERYVGRSEFFQDFLLPRGRRYSMGTRLYQDRRFNFYLAFYHAVGGAPFTRDDIARAQCLVPHFAQLSQLMVRHQAVRVASDIGARALDELDQGVMVLSAQGRVLFANRRAEALLRTGRWLRVQDGRLRTPWVDPTPLDAWLSQVVTSGQPGNRMLREPAVGPAVEAPAWCGLTALSLPHSSLTAQDLGLYEPGRVLLIASEPNGQRSVSVQQLMQLFALTQAEARLAHALVQGQSVDAYAQDNALSMPTVRSQVRAVLAKTDTPRQQDLVRMLARLPSARGRVGH